jgi:hypothetical protein
MIGYAAATEVMTKRQHDQMYEDARIAIKENCNAK